MIRSPILKVLSTLRSHRVRCLLMGGQACVFYGAAEFSRDTDIVLLADPRNLRRLEAALAELKATCIAVPPSALGYLRRGHAVHFRCWHPDAAGLRLDVMSVMRGVAAFPTLWRRRTTIETEDGARYELLALPDLVSAKKTQRDKDWPMIRRLVEANYAHYRRHPTTAQLAFWLKEGRTPSILIELAAGHPRTAAARSRARPLLRLAIGGDATRLAAALADEERIERQQDRAYWAPRVAELERLRHAAARARRGKERTR